ncbi:MAG: hypothetical protein LBD37_00170 [Treponema sp.]|nr:hypothetical protein [Treponema sp.]
MAYYYLAAQLPYLIYGQAAPMTPDAFKAKCQDFLTAKDVGLLDRCALDPEPAGAGEAQAPAYGKPLQATGSHFIDAWRTWELSLRLNLARFRAQRLKREGGAAVDPPDYPAGAVSAAKAAAFMDSPLEAELFLDKTRWDAIEGLEGFHYFGVTTMYAYLLKLRLMERRALFKAEEGFAEYTGLYTAIMDASMAEHASKRNESGEPK